MVLSAANDRTENPILFYVLHHVERVADTDTAPLVDGAIVTLIDMREIRIVKSYSVCWFLHGKLRTTNDIK